jgi:hypothetical protein
MKAYKESRGKAIFIRNLSGGQHHAPAALHIGKNTASVNRKLGGPQIWFGHFGEEKNFLPLLGL